LVRRQRSMSDARRYAVWPEPRSRSRSLKGSRPSVPHGTNFRYYHYNHKLANNSAVVELPLVQTVGHKCT